MKKLLSLSIIVVLATAIFAQSPDDINIIFNEETHNFGTITDADGEATTEFTFINLSSSPIILKHVQASCGCTLPRYSAKPVAPNGIGKIFVGYNPEGRPGFFHKPITIKIGNDKETRTITLYITGNTIPHNNRFTEEMSGLALGSRELSFGSMTKGIILEKSFEIRNTTDKSMRVQFAKLPANLTFEGGNSYTINPEESLKMTAIYDSEKESTFGDYSYPVEVKVNGKTAGTIAVKASVKQPLDKLQKAFEKGAKGYLVKNVSYDELLFAIAHIGNGGRYLCEELAMLLLERIIAQPPTFGGYEGEGAADGIELSDREVEVLQLISDGYTNVEIADKLFLSKRTVEGHRQNLIEKTGVKNSASLIKYAVVNRLVD